MNAQRKPICDTDPSRRGGIDLNAEALGDLYDALKVICGGDVDISNTAIIVGDGARTVIAQCLAALHKAEQVKP